jgi:hypothetical protein
MFCAGRHSLFRGIITQVLLVVDAGDASRLLNSTALNSLQRAVIRINRAMGIALSKAAQPQIAPKVVVAREDMDGLKIRLLAQRLHAAPSEFTRWSA